MTMKTPLEAELSTLMIEALNLEMKPDEIGPDTALYGEGLGLDSIDMLEISLAISKKYGVQLRADDADNERIFASLRALAKHIEERRAQ
jgi:acyl carrier protein